MNKVLIIDDKQANLQAALEQFKDFQDIDLTTISSFEEFDTQFMPNGWGRKVTRKIGSDPDAKTPIEKIMKFDVILTDLMMPASLVGVSDKMKYKSIPVEIPYGLVIAMFARTAGVAKVAIMSKIDHHEGPFMWATDYLPMCSMDLVKKLFYDFDGQLSQEKKSNKRLTPINNYIKSFAYLFQDINNPLGITFLKDDDEVKNWKIAYDLLTYSL